MKIEIRKVDNGFIMQLSGDTSNKRVKKREKVAGSVVEAVGLIAEHMRAAYGED